MTNIVSQNYSKNEFINFLKKINISNSVIKKFTKIPETINYNGNKYDLYINTTWYGSKKTKYIFELNYYSDEIIEFLFNSKVFNDVEISINNLIYELNRNNLI